MKPNKSSLNVIVGPFLSAVRKLDKEKQRLHESIVQTLRECTPGWANADTTTVEVKHLGGAMTNLIFAVSKPEGENEDVLVRIYGKGTDSFFSREEELRVFQLLSDKDLGIGLLGTFANGRVEKLIRGYTFTSKEMRKPAFSELIAQKLRQFHEVELPIDHKPHFMSEIRRLLQVMKKKCKGEKFAGVVDINRLESSIEELDQFLKSVPSKVVMCHNDLQYGNIMKTEDHGDGIARHGVVLIDFEYACYNPRGYDIGNHFCEWAYDYHKTISPHLGVFTRYPNAEQQRQFCRAYLAGDKENVVDEEVEQLRREANAYSQASHLFWSLWGLIQASQSEIDFDFLGYAKCRLDAFYTKVTLQP